MGILTTTTKRTSVGDGKLRRTVFKLPRPSTAHWLPRRASPNPHLLPTSLLLDQAMQRLSPTFNSPHLSPPPLEMETLGTFVSSQPRCASTLKERRTELPLLKHRTHSSHLDFISLSQARPLCRARCHTLYRPPSLPSHQCSRAPSAIALTSNSKKRRRSFVVTRSTLSFHVVVSGEMISGGASAWSSKRTSASQIRSGKSCTLGRWIRGLLTHLM